MTHTGPCTAGRHGTALAYQVDKCRCPDAREAYRIYRKRLRENRHQPLRVPALGTARRLQALAAIGWPATELGRRLGWQRARLAHLRGHKRARINHRTEQRITALYEQLWDQPGPSRSTRIRAATAGWAPPMAWTDSEIDNPNAEPDLGHQPRSRIDDADVTHLRGYGLTRHQIADRLGVTPDSLRDILTRRRKAS